MKNGMWEGTGDRWKEGRKDGMIQDPRFLDCHM